VTKNLFQHANKRGRRLCACYIDITKAYDSVPRHVLHETLQLYGATDKFRKLVEALYDDEIFVALGEKVTVKGFRSRNGVRQGCLMSPLFFNLVMDRVVRTAEPHLKGVFLTDEGGENALEYAIRLYADDIVLFAHSRADMQHNINVVTDALAAAGMQACPKKTKYCCMESRQKEKPDVEVPNSKEMACGRVLWWAPETSCPFADCRAKPKTLSGKQAHIETHTRRRVAVAEARPVDQEIAPRALRDLVKRTNACPFCQTGLNRATVENHWSACPKARKLVKFERVTMTGGRELVLPEADPPLDEPEPDVPLMMYGTQPVERVTRFKYLGRWLTHDDKDTDAVAANVKKANGTLAAVMKRMTRARTSPETRSTVVDVVVMAQLLYGSETWVLAQRDVSKLRTFHMKALRWATGMRPMAVKRPDGGVDVRFPRNKDVLERAKACDIERIVHHRQLRYLGHVLRYPEDDPVRLVWTLRMEGSGRPGFHDGDTLPVRLRNLMHSVGVTEQDAALKSVWRRKVAAMRKRREENHNDPEG
jgi:hypothetical protein